MKTVSAYFTERGFSPLRQIIYLAETYPPSTAYTYAATMQAHCQGYKTDPEWNDRMKTLRRIKNAFKGKVASPLTAETLKRAIASRKMCRNLALVICLWTSASRCGDLIYMKISHTTQIIVDGKMTGLTAILVSMVGSKGDRDGERGDSKALVIPDQLIHLVQPMLGERTSDQELWEFIKEVDPQCSFHSMRRGAVAQLLELSFKAGEIAELTLHGQSNRATIRALNTYMSQSWFREEREKNQISMSLALLRQLGLIQPALYQHVLEKWLMWDPFNSKYSRSFQDAKEADADLWTAQIKSYSHAVELEEKEERMIFAEPDKVMVRAH